MRATKKWLMNFIFQDDVFRIDFYQNLSNLISWSSFVWHWTHWKKSWKLSQKQIIFNSADIHFWKKILSFFNFKVKFIQFLLSKRCTPFVPMFIPAAVPPYGYRNIDGFCCDIRMVGQQRGWTLVQRGKFFPLVFNILNFFKLSNKIKYRTNCFGCTC